MNPIARIAPVRDAEVAAMVSSQTLTDLADQIMSTPVSPAGPRATPRAARRRMAWAAAAAAGLAAAAVTVSAIGPSAAPASAQALAFSRHGRYIDVIIRNALANPALYRAEFRAHGLNVTLQVLPASPSVIGKLAEYSGTAPGISALKPIGPCASGDGSTCYLGIRIPVGFRGEASIAVGRPARPGERYAIAGNATARGEALQGMRIAGDHVSAVEAVLRGRHVTPVFSAGGRRLPAARVPGSWYVYDAVPWAGQQVLLWVGPTRVPPKSKPGLGPVPQPSTPAPQPGTPAPQPSTPAA